MMARDLVYALRSLRRTPGFTAVVILCLALGTGANTAIFSLLDQVLLRTLPIRDPERLVVLHREIGRFEGRSSADNNETVFSAPMYRDLRDRVRVFDGLIARSGMGVTLTGAEAERTSADLVSGNFFTTLAIRPGLGRMLEPDDDQPHAARPVVVLSGHFWMRHYGGNPAALNAVLRVNGVPLTVVGVIEGSFTGMLRGNTADLFIPLGMRGQLDPDSRTWADDRSTRFLNIFGRLKDGMSTERATAGLRAVYQPIFADELSHLHHLSTRERDSLLRDQIQIRPAADGINQLREQWQRPLIALAAIAGLVLLIACANISGLILARAAAREKDVAVRLALGAGRVAVGRPFLLESVIVSLAGAALGLAVARWSIIGLMHLMPDGTNGFLSTAVDGRMLAFSLAIAVLTGILAGLAPAFQASRQEIGVALASQTRSLTAARTGLRQVLVAGQVTLCLILLVAAGLFTRTLYNLSHFDLGFRPTGITVFSTAAGEAGYSAVRSREFYRQIHDRLAALPGVEAIASDSGGPFMGSTHGSSAFLEGDTESSRPDREIYVDALSPGYFSTLGTPLVSGREFADTDREGAPAVAIVNETFAHQFFGAANPMGHRVRFSPHEPWKQIVGVVRNSSWSDARETPNPFVYVPWAQQDRMPEIEWYLRTRSGYDVAADVRRIVHSLDANVPVDGLMAYQVKIADSVYVERLLAILAGVFGGLATLLAALGLYALMAWTLAQRTGEIGIRLALGASTRDVAAMIAREVGRLVLFGIVPGIVAALGAGALIESQLFGVTAHDPVIFASAALVLFVVAALTALPPAIRAARIDPAEALRCE
jgi:putative ABC transport system permease protein